METRDFPTAVIASLSTGIMLCKNFSDMHEAAEYLMGHPIWTHQFADRDFNADIRKTIAAQCPGMPLDAPGIDASNYLDYVTWLEVEFGPVIKIKKGSGLTAMLPTDGIPDNLKDRVVFIDVTKKK